MDVMPNKNNTLEFNNHIAELKGSLIDLFEDFLSERGIIIENEERDWDENLDPEEAANIYGDDYDYLADGIERILDNWGFFDNQVSVETPAGKLIAHASRENDSSQVGLMLVPKGEEAPMDIALCEVKGKTLLKPKELEDTVNLYIWKDPYTDDWTENHQYLRADVEKAFQIEQTEAEDIGNGDKVSDDDCLKKTVIEFIDENVDGCGTNISATAVVTGPTVTDETKKAILKAIATAKEEISDWDTDYCLDAAEKWLFDNGYAVEFVIPTVNITF